MSTKHKSEPFVAIVLDYDIKTGIAKLGTQSRIIEDIVLSPKIEVGQIVINRIFNIRNGKNFKIIKCDHYQALHNTLFSNSNQVKLKPLQTHLKQQHDLKDNQFVSDFSNTVLNLQNKYQTYLTKKQIDKLKLEPYLSAEIR